MAPAGIVLSHSPSTAMVRLAGDAFEVPGHWSWRRVESHLRECGLDLPVATSSVDTTVGGTLSAGGFGVRSIGLGPQVDHVRALRLICADGTVRWCSLEGDRELFCAALTGLGQVGLIERAIIGTRPFRSYLSLVTETYSSFSDLADRAAWLAGPAAQVPDYYFAIAKNGLLQGTFASAHLAAADARKQSPGPRGASAPQVVDTATFEQDERRMPLEIWQQCRNLWCDYCFDVPSFRQFCAFVDEQIAPTLPGHLAYCMCIAPRLGPSLAFDMRPPSQDRLFSLGLFYSPHAEDLRAVNRAMDMQRLALRECLALGGRPYLYGCHGGLDGLSSGTLDRVFGDGYRGLLAARRRVDPFGIFNANALNRS